jgi:hypothetical protein
MRRTFVILMIWACGNAHAQSFWRDLYADVMVSREPAPINEVYIAFRNQVSIPHPSGQRESEAFDHIVEAMTAEVERMMIATDIDRKRGHSDTSLASRWSIFLEMTESLTAQFKTIRRPSVIQFRLALIQARAFISQQYAVVVSLSRELLSDLPLNAANRPEHGRASYWMAVGNLELSVNQIRKRTGAFSRDELAAMRLALDRFSSARENLETVFSLEVSPSLTLPYPKAQRALQTLAGLAGEARDLSRLLNDGAAQESWDRYRDKLKISGLLSSEVLVGEISFLTEPHFDDFAPLLEEYQRESHWAPWDFILERLTRSNATFDPFEIALAEYYWGASYGARGDYVTSTQHLEAGLSSLAWVAPGVIRFEREFDLRYTLAINEIATGPLSHAAATIATLETLHLDIGLSPQSDRREADLSYLKAELAFASEEYDLVVFHAQRYRQYQNTMAARRLFMIEGTARQSLARRGGFQAICFHTLASASELIRHPQLLFRRRR